MKKSLSEYVLSDFYDEKELCNYETNFPSNITMAEYILRYLNSKPGFISSMNNDEQEDIKEKFSNYYHIINQKVLAGKPIEIFFTGFAPKSRKKDITNGNYYPDAGEFLSILHLTLIAKHIRKIYAPGARIIIAYEGSFFHDLSCLTKEQALEVYDVLKLFRNEIERMVRVRNIIEFCNMEDLIDDFKEELFANIEIEKEKMLKREKDGDSELKERVEYFIQEVIELSLFENKEVAIQKMREHVLFSKGFSLWKYKGGEKDLGLQNRYPNAILASMRIHTKEKINENLHIQLLPNEITYPYNRLTVFQNEEHWKLKKWEEIRNEEEYEAVYIEELKTPFYFKKK